MFNTFMNEIEYQFNDKIKRSYSDRGTEYDFSLFNELYKQSEIVHKTSSPYSPKMNGKVKRNNRTLTKLVVSIMLDFGVATL